MSKSPGSSALEVDADGEAPEGSADSEAPEVVDTATLGGEDAPLTEESGRESDSSGNFMSPHETQTPEEQEFGDELATLLGDPPLPEHAGALAGALLRKAQEDPGGLRAWLEEAAKEEAGTCSCETPIPKWDKENPKKTTTCGVQQSFLVSQLDIQVCAVFIILMCVWNVSETLVSSARKLDISVSMPVFAY